MQQAPPILTLQALHRLDKGRGRRRGAEVLRRIEDTVNNLSKPLNQDPGDTTALRRQPSQVGGASPQAIKKQGVITSFATPPSQSPGRVTRSRGGGGEHVLRTGQPASQGQPSWGTTSPPRAGPSGRSSCASLAGLP